MRRRPHSIGAGRNDGQHVSPNSRVRRVLTGLMLAAMTIALQDTGAVDWRVLTTADGLPANDVRTIYEDDTGALWFGTRDAGVARRVGDAWTYYTQSDGLAANGVLDIWQTADGLLWAVGGRGYSRFENGRWTSTQSIGHHTTNVIYDIYEAPRAGTIWLGFNGGAARYDDSEWSFVTPANGLPHAVVHAVWEDPRGRMWFACRQGLAQFAGDNITVFHRDDNFRTIVPGQRDAIWFGTSNGALEMVGGTWLRHLPGQNVHPVLFDRDGVLWAKTDADGVYAYDGDEWRQFSTANGFPNDNVHGIGLAANGTVWFATAAGAVWRPAN